MENDFSIFVVEDDPAAQLMLVSMLEGSYAVKAFASAEACQEALQNSRPDLILLDVCLPGMDGYALCRALKDDAEHKDILVMFVSAQDTIDARLAGYSAGGEDFIVKPFEPDELLDKVTVARRIAQDKAALREQVQAAEQMTDLVLTSMEESGVVLQFLSKIVGTSSEQDIAEGCLHLMKSYRLTGAVQTRIGERSYTLSPEGTNLPLEVSIVDHVRTMDRIFEFGRRTVFNFDHMTVLVHDMPLDNPDFCGRIRDNIAIAGQGADGRLTALEAEEANGRHQQGILEALDSIGHTLKRLGELKQNEKRMTSEIVYELQEDMARSFVNLGLTTGQENHLEDLIVRYIGRLVEVTDRSDEQHAMLVDLSQRLAALGKGYRAPG